MAEKNVQNDFSKGNIPAVVMRMALPLIAAQLVNVLYNVVDRIYIGHIPNVGSMALTGVASRCRSFRSSRRSRACSDRAARRSAPWRAAAEITTRPPA